MKTRVLISKSKMNEEELKKVKEANDVVREDEKEIIVLAEDGAVLAKTYEGLQEMNEV